MNGILKKTQICACKFVRPLKVTLVLIASGAVAALAQNWQETMVLLTAGLAGTGRWKKRTPHALRCQHVLEIWHCCPNWLPQSVWGCESCGMNAGCLAVLLGKVVPGRHPQAVRAAGRAHVGGSKPLGWLPEENEPCLKPRNDLYIHMIDFEKLG